MNNMSCLFLYACLGYCLTVLILLSHFIDFKGSLSVVAIFLLPFRVHFWTVLILSCDSVQLCVSEIKQLTGVFVAVL